MPEPKSELDRMLAGELYRPADSELASVRRLARFPVAIGSDVWIGGGAIICPGVEIGDGAVIGAGSVVTRNTPARSLAVGNPCRVVRSI